MKIHMQWILIWHWSNTSFCWEGFFCFGWLVFYVLIQIFIILLCAANWSKLSVPDIWSAASLEISPLTPSESNPCTNKWERTCYATHTFIKENTKISFHKKYHLENSIRGLWKVDTNRIGTHFSYLCSSRYWSTIRGFVFYAVFMYFWKLKLTQ